MIELIVLFFILIIVFFIPYVGFRGDVLAPGVIVVAAFMMTTFFAILGNRQWGASITAETVIVVAGGVLFFVVGCQLCGRRQIKLLTQKLEQEYDDFTIFINPIKMVVLIIYEMVALYIYYKKIISIASSVGYSGTMLIQYVRVATAVLDINVGGTVAIISSIISPSTFISLYIVIQNLIQKRKGFFKNYFLYLISITIGFISILLGGAREGMIILMYLTIFMIVFIARKTESREIKIGKVLKYILLISFVVYFLFTFMGTFTGKTVVGDELNNFYMYAGGGIPAFSKWFEAGIRGFDNFGKQSFSGLYSLIDKAIPGIAQGLDSGITIVRFPDGTSTNVFTCFRAYIFEFGVFGCFSFMMFLGFVFTGFYNAVKANPSVFRIIMYAYMSRALVYLIFTPTPTSTFLSVTQILTVFWLYIVGRIFVGNDFFAVKTN